MIEYRIVRSCQLTNNPAQITLFLQCILHQVMFPRSSRNFLQKTCAEHAMNREMGLISYFIKVWKMYPNQSHLVPRGFMATNFVNKIEDYQKVQMKEMRHFV